MYAFYQPKWNCISAGGELGFNNVSIPIPVNIPLPMSTIRETSDNSIKTVFVPILNTSMNAALSK
jgi:hypothetical protein